tara:strand:+ start:54 stop:236 length:183 start_codon:yes stop_codon:yes gene_type:complete
MKDLKTTIAGLIAGVPMLIDALLQAYNAGAFNEKSGVQLALAVGLVLLAYFAKDKTVKTE